MEGNRWPIASGKNASRLRPTTPLPTECWPLSSGAGGANAPPEVRTRRSGNAVLLEDLAARIAPPAPPIAGELSGSLTKRRMPRGTTT